MKKSGIKSRTFNIMQYEYNPVTGEDLNFNEMNISSGLQHKTIIQWAYVLHDKDVWLEQDEINNPEHKAGEIKPKHWHIVCKTSQQIDVAVISRWFGVPENMIDVPKGTGCFLDCVEYLTHEREIEKDDERGKKHLYDDEEIKASFDFRDALVMRAIKIQRHGKDLSEKDYYRHEVLYNGLSLTEIQATNPTAYINDFATLDKLRKKYITENMPLPLYRANYYISGAGGVGKGVMSEMLARSMYPDIEDDDNLFYKIGGRNVTFENYSGQPVIIWDDKRAPDLLSGLGGRDGVFNVFDNRPTKQVQNIKNSYIRLCNAVNIINGIDDYKTFLDGLSGTYRDKAGNFYEAEDVSQSYRRFPFIINIHEDDFDLLINKGFAEGTREFEQYTEYKGIRGRMQAIAENLNGVDRQTRQRIESSIVKLVVDKHNEIKDTRFAKKSDEELAEFEQQLLNEEWGSPTEIVDEMTEERVMNKHIFRNSNNPFD